MPLKNKKSRNRKGIKIGAIISDKVGNYEKDPFLVKKAKEDRAFLKKVGIPKHFLKKD